MRYYKRIILVATIFILLIFCILLCYKHYCNNRILIHGNYVKVEVMWIGEDLETEDEIAVNKIVDYINQMDKELELIPNQTCESPDSTIAFIDENGNRTTLHLYENYMSFAKGRKGQYQVNADEIGLFLRKHVGRLTK